MLRQRNRNHANTLSQSSEPDSARSTITVSSESSVPSDLYYTAEHEVGSPHRPRRRPGGYHRGTHRGGAGRCGLRSATCRGHRGDRRRGVRRGGVDPKSVSDLYAPITASVIAVNAELDANPQLVNSDYGAGWLLELRVAASSAGLDQSLAGLLSTEAYRATLSE